MNEKNKNKIQYSKGILPGIEPGIIRTYTGIMFNVWEPKPEDICIEDIAHALSNLCRFGGHTAAFYSVAEHCVRAVDLVAEKHKLAALLHDASEAYLVDMPTPIKMLMPDYYKVEYKLMEVIAAKFGFEYPLVKEVELADKAMLEKEWFNFMDIESPYWTLNPNGARISFLAAFDRCCEK